ncbi:MAG: nucleoside deaminase [Candidatus Roizmanbacteria bacterium]
MDTIINEQFIALAIEEAKAAKANGDWPFGAVVVKDGKVVGKGHVTDKSGGDVTDHAELRALRDACRNLSTNNLEGCSIYCSNEPCLMCAAGIFQSGIRNVYIGASRDDLPLLLRPRKLRIEDAALDSGHEIKIQRDLLKDQILALFQDIHKK